ncbi:MAG: FtsX-like permease family protein [Clostridia bacterium]|nr:FtsX-like permease family protein [Clostridia bacterium]
MNILSKFTIQNLKLNKKRTIVTIIGIMLSTALICGVAGLVSSFQESLINAEKQLDGNYHATFSNVAKENLKYVKDNNSVENYFLTNQIGWAKLESSKNENKPYLFVLEFDKNALNNYGLKLLEGRMPENSNEVVISEHIKTNARVKLNIGDDITLNIGKRKAVDGTIITTETSYINGITDESIVDTNQKSYTIVGIIKRPNYTIEGFANPGYTIITYMEEVTDTANISVLYKKPKDYCENNELIKEVIKTDDVYTHQELLRWQGAIGENTMKVLYGIAAVVIVIIVVSSIFVIRNSFSISVSEKNKQYGMLSSIGATSKQIRKTVLLEGFVIGAIAIPLGIILGIVAIVILLQIVNYLLGDMLNDMRFIYSIPVIAILISIAISFITIYLSCLIPARRAAKISPIDSIRGNNDIKIKSKRLKTSKFIKKFFGIGGTIASKNLKRSRKKYRTTVISIVISIVIFISLSTFIECGNKSSEIYYMELGFNMIVDNGTEEIYKEIAKLDDIENYSYYYESGANIDIDKYGTDFGKEMTKDSSENGLTLIAYNNEYFKQYIKELGLKEEEYKTAVILIDEVVKNHTDNTKSFEKIYNLTNGSQIPVTINEKEVNITISKNTDKRPMGQEGTFYTSGMLIVSKDFAKQYTDNLSLGSLFIQSKNTVELENILNDLSVENLEYSEINVFNYETMVDQQNRMVLVISIFLYGFMTVITLIGVTNIFNTITTNMILRSKEFAMLKSIGMTTKEFNKMIRLESILYGLKSLLIGIPIGIFGSYMIYKSFAESIDVGYFLPWKAIILSIIFVFIIVGLTMKYSLNKINKQNIIETIRKDNI